jgi:hypothetical protein
VILSPYTPGNPFPPISTELLAYLPPVWLTGTPLYIVVAIAFAFVIVVLI